MSTVLIGSIPDRIREKAERLVVGSHPLQEPGWKKLKRVRGCYSYRLSQNYRLLWLHDKQLVICDHDHYVRKINSFRNRRCRHACDI